MYRTLIIATLCSLGSVVFSAKADQYHYGNLLVGGKANGYGGAFVAISDDLSAMHYNPAGLSFQSSARSASVNTMAWEQTEFNNAFFNDDDFTRKSFAVVPGFLGISGHSDNWSYGTFFTVTDFSQERTTAEAVYTLPATFTSYEQQMQEFVDYDFDNAAYKIGFSGAYKLSDEWSIGATLAGRYISEISAQGSGAVITYVTPEGNVPTGFHAYRRINDSTYLLSPSVGVLWKTPSLNIGANITKDIALSRSYETLSSVSAPIAAVLTSNVFTSFREEMNSTAKQTYPWHISAGLAYKVDGWVFSSQIDYFTAVTEAPAVANYNFPVTRELDSVTNLALAVSMPLAEHTKLIVSYFSDNSNGKIDTSVDYQRVEAIDTHGVSIALESMVFDYPFTVGVYAKSGRGKVRFADIRVVNDIMGAELYPATDDFDIDPARKSSVVIFASMDF